MDRFNSDQKLRDPAHQSQARDRTTAGAEPATLRNGVQDVKMKNSNLSEEELADSEVRYRRLFETAQDGILILDAETGLIADVNPFLLKLLHYSRVDLLGKALWEIGLFKDIGASKEAFRELQAKGYVRYEDLPLKSKIGK